MRGVNKYIVVLLSAVFAFGAIIVGMKYSSSKIPKDTTTSSSAVEKTTNLSVNDLFLDQNHVFLGEDITDSYIDKVKETVDQGNQEEVALLNSAIQRWTIQKALNQLFTAPALIGSRVVESPTLAEGVTEADKQQVVASVDSSGITDEFATTVKEILGATTSTSGSGNLSGDSAVAQERLSHLVVDGVVMPDFTLESYNNARDAIAALPMGEERTELAAQLKLVENAMDQMGVQYTPLPAY
ncbi:hypothetical protein I6N95_09765 [Vagococcus sp. BWB3-3]|uniref:MapZ extracellular domain-containing protein n=1 Tax=Vagococcus allomyrinae TaxID=2794353 RepID=A0A940SWE4_9ENTE|nr:hypothetical protein [Vagococcus allomyrinae]MBP1041293.1 hypothetical protein [Vagococcus allomyrinae]